MASTLTQWLLAAETKEFVGPITVTADGSPVAAFDVAISQGTTRPTGWKAADNLDGERGILVGAGTDWPLRVGQIYTVWVRYTDNPEVPVEKCGTIKVY